MKKNLGVKRLFSLALLEKTRLSWGLVFLMLGSSMLLIYPQIIREMVDGALTKKSYESLNNTATIVFFVFILQAIAGAGRYYLFTSAGERIVTKLRQQIFQSIIDQDIEFFDQRRTGELMSRLAADATVVQNAVSVNVSMFMRNLGAAVGGLILLIYTSPVLSLGLLACIPPLAFGTARFGQKVRKLAKKTQDALAETSSIAEESISGIRTVRSFNQESREKHRYQLALGNTLSISLKKIRLIAGFIGATSLLGYLAVVGVLYYGAYLVIDGKMSIGDLTSFLLYTLTVAVSVATLASLWTDFMAATGAGKRIFEIIDQTKYSRIRQKGEIIITQLQGSLRFENVSFSYPSRNDIQVLDQVSFELQAGERVALVGPSGGGKSTIASLISRFYEIESGKIYVDEKSVDELDANWLRQQIGLVSQDPVLMSTSIADNIRYSRPEASLEEVMEAAKAANAHDFIISFPEGYDTLVGERGLQLSGGQRQRVAIARAMLKNPKLLILDEATSALDAESEKLVQVAIERLMEKRTSLVIAHRLATIQNADRVMVIDKGRVAESGTHQSLMNDTQGLYYKLVNMQSILPANALI